MVMFGRKYMDELINEMMDAGLEPPSEIIADGVIHRYAASDERQKNCWYILHSDEPVAGAFGHWKTGLNVKFNSAKKLSQDEKRLYREKVNEAKAKRLTEQKKEQQECRDKAAYIWGKSISGGCLMKNKYIARKVITPYRARLNRGSVVLPVMDSKGLLHGLQFIQEDGSKKFLYGTAKKGCYLSIGRITDTLLICEGYATGASLHECTGLAVAVSFDAGNLEPAAMKLRAKFPTIKIIICADNDDIGIDKAIKASDSVNGLVVYPPKHGQDFNDYHITEGKLALSRLLS